MGRTGSCFRIITCGSDSAEKDDVVVSESKNSSDKRGWSFRKRSERHRVLNNTVITETPSEHTKSKEPAAVKFQVRDSSTDPGKTSLGQCIEEKPVLMQVEPKVAEPSVVGIKEGEVGVTADESLVVVIQTAIRGIMAQRELGKLKNLVKLQAAVRGHLVRRHAVGTLRCVQAIVKMQALVRARYAHLSVGGEHDEDLGKVALKPNAAGNSIEKLLNTRFARQLMESTPKTKPIRIKCDPSKPNSAWNWLERWMSVSSIERTERTDSMANQSERVKGENHASPKGRHKCENHVSPVGRDKNEDRASPVDDKILSEAFGESAGTKSDNVKETIVPSDGEENLITYDATDLKFEPCQPTFLVTDYPRHSHLESTSPTNMVETSVELSTNSNQSMELDTNSQTDVSHLPHRPEVETEPPKRSMKRSASEQLETEGKKFVSGSRRASNPAFIAAQSKFEELSSVSESGTSITSSYQDVMAKSNTDTATSGVEAILQTTEPNITETKATNISRVHHGGSECGTELSISSTLDSPDTYEVGTGEQGDVAKASDQERGSYEGDEIKTSCTTPMPNSSDLVNNQLGKLSNENGDSMNSAELVDSPQVEEQRQRNTSDVQRELETSTGHQVYGSPEASPKSHMTVPESQGTPTSEVSVKAKKGKKEKSNQKRKSQSASNYSPANLTPESGVRSSTEQSAKDQKNGKRHNSFGSSRHERTDQEPRDSNTGNSLPHFMQATESARAKINASSSPRSSPDVQDRDIYVTKRHSLPAANGRQGSPRIQRSMSQVQQNLKGNERKWQR